MASIKGTAFGGQRGKQTESLLKSIQGNESLSDVTKSELSARLAEASESAGGGQIKGKKRKGFDAQIADINKTLEEASEGIAPKFASRQSVQRQRTLLADRPGRSQTVLSRG